MAVYETVAPSGRNPQLEVELSPSIFTGASRKAQHVPTTLQGRWSSNGRRESEADCLKRDENS